MEFYRKLREAMLAALNVVGPMTFAKCDGMMLQEAANVSRELHKIIKLLERLERIANHQDKGWEIDETR